MPSKDSKTSDPVSKYKEKPTCTEYEIYHIKDGNISTIKIDGKDSSIRYMKEILEQYHYIYDPDHSVFVPGEFIYLTFKRQISHIVDYSIHFGVLIDNNGKPTSEPSIVSAPMVYYPTDGSQQKICVKNKQGMLIKPIQLDLKPLQKGQKPNLQAGIIRVFRQAEDNFHATQIPLKSKTIVVDPYYFIPDKYSKILSEIGNAPTKEDTNEEAKD